MPNYSYQCENKHRIDTSHSIFDDPEIICGECQGRMFRLPSGVVHKFMGSGFYTTDKDA